MGPNTRLINYSINTLISNYTHIGFKKNLLNNEFRRAVLGFYWNAVIINPSVTLAALKTATQTIFSILLSGYKIGVVVFDAPISVTRRPFDFFKYNYYVFNYWPSGLISNFFRVFNTWSARHKNPNHFPTPPRALFVIASNAEHKAADIDKECKKFRIPAFSVVDSISDLSLFRHWIPANTKSTLSVDFFINYISSLIELGRCENLNKFVVQTKMGLAKNQLWRNYITASTYTERDASIFTCRANKNSPWTKLPFGVDFTVSDYKPITPLFNRKNFFFNNKPKSRKLSTKSSKIQSPRNIRSTPRLDENLKNLIRKVLDSQEFKDRRIALFKHVLIKNKLRFRSLFQKGPGKYVQSKFIPEKLSRVLPRLEKLVRVRLLRGLMSKRPDDFFISQIHNFRVQKRAKTPKPNTAFARWKQKQADDQYRRLLMYRSNRSRDNFELFQQKLPKFGNNKKAWLNYITKYMNRYFPREILWTIRWYMKKIKRTFITNEYRFLLHASNPKKSHEKLRRILEIYKIITKEKE